VSASPAENTVRLTTELVAAQDVALTTLPAITWKAAPSSAQVALVIVRLLLVAPVSAAPLRNHW